MSLLRRLDVAERGVRAVAAVLAAGQLEDAPEVEAAVRAIVGDVRARGDAAVREQTERLEGRSPLESGYAVSAARWQAACDRVRPKVAAALGRAADRIRRFHAPQVTTSYALAGGALGLRAQPLARVGLYAPGGTARYPSSVLMTGIPARLAGVAEIILCTPGASDETLLAARIAGVTAVFELGGAQAIAALAYGTASVPRVDKIVGPGNQFVAAAKRLVFGQVDIDSIAGPSEIVVVADQTARPAWVAADLLAQAEHDREARPILIARTAGLVPAVEAELDRQLEGLPRAEIARAALTGHGAAVVAPAAAEVAELCDLLAPEHLELCCADAEVLAERIANAGAIFIGSFSPEAAGDYLAGPNHVLPTAGAARYASPLGVYDFIKHVSILRLDAAELAAIAGDIEILAEVEGLAGHARSVACRREGA